MELAIAKEIEEAYPGVEIGWLRVRGLDNHGPAAALAGAVGRAAARVRARFPDGAGLESDPALAAWRQAYRRMGADPRKHRPTVEALARRAAKGGALGGISPLVDAYIAVSLEHFLPIGGYDVAALRGGLVLRTSPGDEPFLGIGSERAESTFPGEVVYADAEGVLTRMWNYRDGDRAKITPDTREAVLFMEGLGGAGRAEIAAALKDLAARLAEACGGECDLGFVEKTAHAAAVRGTGLPTPGLA